MAQIYQYDKRTGVTYVYDSESYYDPQKKQSRSKRKLIGKIDPETGEIVPTGKKGRKKSQTSKSEPEQIREIKEKYDDAIEQLKKCSLKYEQLKSENTALRKEISQLRLALINVEKALMKSKSLYDPS